MHHLSEHDEKFLREGDIVFAKEALGWGRGLAWWWRRGSWCRYRPHPRAEVAVSKITAIPMMVWRRGWGQFRAR